MKNKDRILVVDDNPVNIAIMEELLEEEYLVEIAETGHEALEIASRFHPDLILLDIMMPGIDGYETCRRIRKDPVLTKSKIIMVSAKAMLSDRLEGYEAGADDYLTKPFEEAEFLAKVKVYLNLKSVEEIDNLKNDILTLIKHESFTPINGIQMSAELLKEGISDPDEYQELVDIILQSSQRLHSFLNKILTYSSLKSGNTRLNLNKTSLTEIVKSAHLKHQSKIENKNLIIDQSFQSDASVLIDIEQIESVVMNILDNAIRFSQKNGNIKLETFQEGNSLILKIKDQGSGIESNRLQTIFEPFHVEDINYHSEGHGLSLALADILMELHGGSMRIDSEIDKGTTVTLNFPLHH